MILDGKEVNEIIISRQDGKLVNILNWDVTEMPIEEIAHNLANTNRYGGAQPTPVSVALHSILVSYMVPESYAYEALMHDATEAFVGDVMHPIKALCPNFRAIEAEVHKLVARNYSLPLVESRVVKLHDVRARDLECLYRRGGFLTDVSNREVNVCNFLLVPDYTPEHVSEMFLARYESARSISLSWH